MILFSIITLSYTAKVWAKQLEAVARRINRRNFCAVMLKITEFLRYILARGPYKS